jgi:cytochrome d ubiquinol oxidase subunit II
MLQHDAAAILWYAILAVAWTVYLAQESYIVGSGMLHRFGYGPAKRRSIQLSAGLHYDGIEVWLIVAVGGTFAAFPPVFATILSSLYVPFFLLIASLIVRAISIEFMYKDESPAWRDLMSILWSVSSLLVPFVLGVYFANVFGGIAVDASGYKGYILELFGPVGLAGGLFFAANAAANGSAWIRLTTIEDKDGKPESKTAAIALSCLALFGLIVLFLGLNNKTSLFSASALLVRTPLLWVLPALAVAAAILQVIAAWRDERALRLISGIASLVLAMASLFAAAFPRMVMSSIDSGFGIDAIAGSSSQTTLGVMTWVAVVFIPIVIGYQSWKYAHFRKDKNEEK